MRRKRGGGASGSARADVRHLLSARQVTVQWVVVIYRSPGPRHSSEAKSSINGIGSV